MQIAIPTDGDNQDAQINDRFGRCRRFLLVDAATGSFAALDNGQSAGSPSPGIVSAQMLINHGVDAVIASSCGPNACKLFEAAGITVVTGVSGRIRDAVVRFTAERDEWSNPGPGEGNVEDRDRQR